MNPFGEPLDAVQGEPVFSSPRLFSVAMDAESPERRERKLVRSRFFSSDSRIASSTTLLRDWV